MYNITLLVLVMVLLGSAVTVINSVSIRKSPGNPTLDNATENYDSGSKRVNYSSLFRDAAGGVDGPVTPGIDFSSIRAILQSLQLLASRWEIRHVIPIPQGVNATCYDETINFLDALLGHLSSNRSNMDKTPNWALQMFDAFGKPGSGVLEGSLQWVGAYKECLDVHAYIPAGTRFGSRVLKHASEFDTRYCRVEILLDRGLWKHSNYASKMNKFWHSVHSPDLVLNWGVCLPQSCKGEDMQRLLSGGLLSSLKVKVQDVVCYEEDSTIQKDSWAIFMIILLSLAASVLITCTIKETFWYYIFDEKSQSPKQNNGHALNDTDMTLIIPAPNGVESDVLVLNGISSPSKTKHIPAQTVIGNGTAGKTTCNGVGMHGKDFNEEERREFHNTLNGHEGKHNNTDSKHYQINTACDDSTETEGCSLNVDTDIPNGQECKTQDGRKTCLQETTKSKQEGLGPRVVKAFSMRINLIRLLKTSGETRPGVIRCLEGMRVISMLWIILGHTYTFGAVMDNGNLMFANTVDVARTTAKISFFLVTGATFAVDTFFLMSGLLVTMLTLKDLKKNRPTCGFWSMFFFHRYLRLTPVYMVVLMFCVTMYDHMVSGPLKSLPLKEYDDCHSKWWTHLLYINNFYQPQQKCMTWTWYLAVDMQLFSIAPIVIYVIHRSTRLGKACILLLICAGMMSAFLSQYYFYGQFVLMDQVFTDYWEHVYIRPWTRIGAFAIGMFTGVILFKRDQKLAFSKVSGALKLERVHSHGKNKGQGDEGCRTVGPEPSALKNSLCCLMPLQGSRGLRRLKTFFIWMALAGVAICIIFIPHNQWQEGSNLWSQSEQALYEALSRPTWAACMAVVVYMCHTGRGGLANNILSWPGFQPLARLTYSVYLIHPVVMTFFVYSRNTPVYLQDSTIMYQYIGNVVLSYLFGTVLCIMFESPIMTLEKILLGSR